MKKCVCLLVLLLSAIIASAQARRPLAAAATQHGIQLNWTLSPTPGVTSQLICRSTTTGTENCGTPLTTIPDGTTKSFLDTTGTAGTTYFYVAEACIGSICSVPSNEASATFPTVPAPQTGLTAVPQ